MSVYIYLATDPGELELCLALKFSADVSRSQDGCHSSSRGDGGLEQGHDILPISDVVKVNIFPQISASTSFNVFGGP